MEEPKSEFKRETKSNMTPPFSKLKKVAKSAGDRGKVMAKNLSLATKNSDLKKALVERKHELSSKAHHLAHATKASAKTGSQNLKRVLDAHHAARKEKPSKSNQNPASSESDHQRRQEIVANDQDRRIIWIVVASIFVVRNFENWHEVVDNKFSFDLVFVWMLAAFLLGLELDMSFLIGRMKAQIFGLEETQQMGMGHFFSIETAEKVGRRFGIKSFLAQESKEPQATIANCFPKTCLQSHKPPSKQKQKVVYHVNLTRRLASRFRANRDQGLDANSDSTESGDETEITSTSNSSLLTEVTDQTEGYNNARKTGAVKLPNEFEVEVEPLFRLRGLDIFLTDCAEEHMGTHPYLLKNGLRDCPTFMVNIVTQWGTVLIYFEMPSWIEKFGTCLEVSDDDKDDVKVLKRFLSGDDTYKKRSLKLMHEIVDAPYAARMLAPKVSELEVQCDGLVETSYRYYDPAENYAPLLELTIDFISNGPIRGMSSLMKRYLHGLSLDFALVVVNPEGPEWDEPGAILGLFKMDHIDIANYGSLPARNELEAETEGSS